MIFSYRTRRFLRRFFQILLTAVVVCVVLVLLWLLWLQRFIIYTPQGAILDFSGTRPQSEAVLAKPPLAQEEVSIQFSKNESEAPAPEGLQQLTGAYLVLNDLKGDLDSLQQKLLALPKGTAVMIDVKSIWGYFYYPTQLGYITSSSLDMERIGSFFEALNSSGLYTIARMPAFKDHEFARTHQSCGLAAPGGYLHAGADKCYWLEPYNDTVQTFLVQITKELQKLGFREVVYKDFCFPATDKLAFTGDRPAALAKAAQTLVTACANDGFVVSFQTNDLSFQLPEGNCRIYLESIAAADVSATLSQLGLADASTRVVMLAESNDTRYEVCGVLRPAELAI